MDGWLAIALTYHSYRLIFAFAYLPACSGVRYLPGIAANDTIDIMGEVAPSTAPGTSDMQGGECRMNEQAQLSIMTYPI